MAVQVDLRYPAYGRADNPETTTTQPAGLPAHKRLRSRRIQRRLRSAAELAAWLAGSTLLTLFIALQLAALR
jgi:hypothetical protein